LVAAQLRRGRNPALLLLQCFEAARWAPSSTNQQPWRFLFARRGSRNFPLFVDVMTERNRMWAQHAAAIIYFLSKKIAVVGPQIRVSKTHEFDAGAAWENFALQASLLGWHTHAMGGFDRENAPKRFGVPENIWHFNCVVAIGKLGDKAALEKIDPRLAAREAPNGRVPLDMLLMEDEFKPELTDFPTGTPGAPVVPTDLEAPKQ
jgi:nitroreductase